MVLAIPPISLYKESLNSDGQQFHQYQQNEQPPLISTCNVRDFRGL